MKNFIKLISLLMILMFFTSCNPKNKTIKTFEFEHIEDINLPLKSDFYNQAWYTKFVKNDTSIFLIYLSNKHLFTYDLSNKKLLSDLSIPLFMSIFAQNLDSIFILMHNNSIFEDSTIILCNYLGEIKNTYNLKELFANNKLIKNLNLSEHKNIYIRSIYFSNNKLFLILMKNIYYDYINDSAYKSIRIPTFAEFDLKTNKLNLSKIYDLPFQNENGLMNRNYEYIYNYLNQKTLLCGLMFTNKMLKYNLETSKIVDTIAMDSYFLDSLIIDNKQSMYLSQAYLDLDYIKELNIFVRNCKLDVYNEIYSQIIFDTNFKKIGEYIVDSISLENNFIDDKMYVYNQNRTIEKDSTLVISVYKVKLKTTKLDSLKTILDKKRLSFKSQQCNVNTAKEDIDIKKTEKYISNKIKKNSFTILITPIFTGCEPCIEECLNFYSMNFDLFSQANIYLFALDNNKKAVISKLKQHNIPPSSETVVIDSLDNYQQLFNNFTMQHLIIVKNKKIIFAKSYYPNELDSMYKKILENF